MRLLLFENLIASHGINTIRRITNANGVKVVSATEAISAGAEGILLESLLEGYVEYYSAKLSEKVTRGLTENALKYKYNSGKLPIGYMINSEQYFQIDPLTAPAVLDAFKHYADGASMREITDEMNLKGIRTKRQNQHKQRNPNASQQKIYRRIQIS